MQSITSNGSRFGSHANAEVVTCSPVDGAPMLSLTLVRAICDLLAPATLEQFLAIPLGPRTRGVAAPVEEQSHWIHSRGSLVQPLAAPARVVIGPAKLVTEPQSRRCLIQDGLVLLMPLLHVGLLCRGDAVVLD